MDLTEVTLFHCWRCCISFEDINTWHLHVYEKHSIGYNVTYPCHVCTRTRHFKSINNWWNHMSIYHNEI